MSGKPNGHASDSHVSRYHSPPVTIVIPHYNYADLIGDALISVQQQTHKNLTCIIVDDHSEASQFEEVCRLVAEIGDSRFSLIRNEENMGMVHSIYRGLQLGGTSFVTVLDPDDRYAPTFIEKMLAVHLNKLVFCPLACCDQFLLKIGEGIITSTQNAGRFKAQDDEEAENALYEKHGFHKFISPLEKGWHWTTTSSMMFRADALDLFRPTKTLAYKGYGDAFCAYGAHMLGGTLLLREPLVYRGLHGRNDFISRSVFSLWQRQYKDIAEPLTDSVKMDVAEAFLMNRGMQMFNTDSILDVLSSQFTEAELEQLAARVPNAKGLLA
mgnify:CR=1 FL=1